MPWYLPAAGYPSAVSVEPAAAVVASRANVPPTVVSSWAVELDCLPPPATTAKPQSCVTAVSLNAPAVANSRRATSAVAVQQPYVALPQV